jgi:valyl-tRNA synthetase
MNSVVAEVDTAYAQYHFAKVCETLYHFAWDELFDWYIELAKPTINQGGPEAANIRAVLGHVLDVTLRLLHPIIPFVTEELWVALTNKQSITIAPWPHAELRLSAPDAEHTITALQRVITEVRRFRIEQGLKPGQQVPARIIFTDPLLAGHEEHIRTLNRLDPPSTSPAVVTAVEVAGVRVELDLFGAVDFAAERRRLAKDLAAAEKTKQQAQSRLSDHAFITKAPDTVVATTQARVQEAAAEITRITRQLAVLPQS